MAPLSSRIRHPWDVTTAQARVIQEQYCGAVRRRNGPELRNIRHVAGVDVSIRRGQAVAAVSVLQLDTLELTEHAVAQMPVAFPYVPGLLSFREIPVVLTAWKQLRITPELVLVDGQGIAHPRRFGLASHLGVLLDRPTIGCAKSRYIGVHDEPCDERGSYVDLYDGDELIGGVLRTRDRVKPLYISIGHKIDLPTALDFVLDCGHGFRLPEPTRLAHRLAGAVPIEDP